jgi:glutamate-1-semialdehyde 2,1-aminomutase
MTLHATDRTLRNASDLQGTDARVKDLIYFALLERGVYMARRGFIALSLPFGDAEAALLVAALDEVLAAHREVLPTTG